ncbi:MAG: hypothetical protein AAF231_15680, partial [Pseudomonadota bacterium]
MKFCPFSVPKPLRSPQARRFVLVPSPYGDALTVCRTPLARQEFIIIYQLVMVLCRIAERSKCPFDRP